MIQWFKSDSMIRNKSVLYQKPNSFLTPKSGWALLRFNLRFKKYILKGRSDKIGIWFNNFLRRFQQIPMKVHSPFIAIWEQKCGHLCWEFLNWRQKCIIWSKWTTRNHKRQLSRFDLRKCNRIVSIWMGVACTSAPIGCSVGQTRKKKKVITANTMQLSASASAIAGERY